LRYVLCSLLSWSLPGLTIVIAQDIPPTKNRGQLFFSWGYNRDWYSNSTIHFVKTNADPSKSYDFTLYDATADDKPDYDDYWDLGRLTVPQYDFRVGYQFNDKHDLGLEINWDHLKYVVTDWQNVHINGQKHGIAIDKVEPLNPDTVHLQHTNGNNYLLFNLTKRKTLYTYRYFQVDAIGKVGAGPLISYTISTILGDYDPGYFHYHGWVSAASLGMRVSFLKNFFIQSDIQGAFVDYTNIKLGRNHDGLATHTFCSLQWSWEGGIILPIGKK
jgi:hypothetical protein